MFLAIVLLYFAFFQKNRVAFKFSNIFFLLIWSAVAVTDLVYLGTRWPSIGLNYRPIHNWHIRRHADIYLKVLLNKAEYDVKNYPDQLRWITATKVP